MMRPFLRALVLTCVLGRVSAAADTPAPRPSPPPRPADGVGERVRAILATTESQRVEAARGLVRAKDDDAALTLLDSDPSARVRIAIVSGYRGRLGEPGIRAAVERRIAEDGDASVVRSALEVLRVYELERIHGRLRARLRASPEAAAGGGRAPAGDSVAALQALDEQWVSFVRGTMLPAFLRVPPAPFTLVPPGRAVRVAAFGDYGIGTPAQKLVAAALLRAHQNEPFDFGVTLGDNFYPKGMESPKDPRWKTLWEELYEPLGIPIYASLGNHDWDGPDGPAAELLYAQVSPSFKMPAPYYTYLAGPVQFFALDTTDMSAAQRRWLDEGLAASQAPWKVVYGHHPIYSDGAHGDTGALVRDLLPLLRGRVQVYLCGHEHDMQHLKPEDGVHFFVSGGGGARIRAVTETERSFFARSTHGFSVVAATDAQLTVGHYAPDLTLLHEHTLKR